MYILMYAYTHIYNIYIHSQIFTHLHILGVASGRGSM